MAGKLKELDIDSVAREVDIYKAGTNVSFTLDANDNKYAINATDTTYSAGTNISISAQNAISADLTGYATENYVDAQISAITQDEMHYEVVQSLPVTGDIHTIYLLPKQGANGDIYEEYLWVNGDYEMIGTTSADLSNYYTKTETDNLLADKQDELTPGANITIANDVISATDTTYTAGTNVSISPQNVISATDTTYTAGTNISISGAGVISATDTTYSAGTGITISNGAISVSLSKQQILTMLGYEEIDLKMTDDVGTVHTWTILASTTIPI